MKLPKGERLSPPSRTKMMSIKDLHQHIVALCDEHEIMISWLKRPKRGWAKRSVFAESFCKRPSRDWATPAMPVTPWFDEIGIAPVRSTISYAIALHELGHILGRHQQSENLMVRERWAWIWARAHALRWTAAMDRCAAGSLDRHEHNEGMKLLMAWRYRHKAKWWMSFVNWMAIRRRR
jgi:hypothetical protein